MTLVSIIMPTYNAENFVEKSIRSVINQTYENWELIIVDDASSDNTWDLLNKFALSNSRIFCFRLNQNQGAARARNFGIEKSKGEFIAFLDCDDIFKPNKIEKQIEFMNSNNALASHTSVEVIRDGKFIKFTSGPDRLYYKDLLKLNQVITSTVILKSKLVENFRMPDIRNRQDWAFWLLLSKKTPFFFIDAPFTSYWDRKGSISSNKLKMICFHWVIYHKIEKLNFFQSIFYLTRNIFYHLLKG